MASASFGDGNRGFQAHTINGSVSTTFNLHPGKPPVGICGPRTAGPGPALTTVPERPETPPKPSCVIPFRRDTDFVDRGTLLDQIHEKCSAPASRAALVGLGGVGYVERSVRLGLATNVGTGSRSSPLSTAIVSKRRRRTRGCSGCTQAHERGWKKGIAGSPRRRR